MQEDQGTEEYVVFEEQNSHSIDKFKDLVLGKYFLPIAIVLLSISTFALGRISGLQERKPPLRIVAEQKPSTDLTSGSGGEVKGVSVEVSTASGVVVASKNGSKYHYPWCAGAKQISDKNKITFNSIEEARAAGFTPASNCKGLK